MALKIPFSDALFNRTPARNAATPLEIRLEGTAITRTVAELVGNSALFPILDSIRSVSEHGFAAYFQEPAHYVLWIACFIQALYLGSKPKHSWPKKFLGNLIGVSLYTIVEIGIEGLHFFQAPYHLVFWEYSAILALMNTWQQLAREQALVPTILLNLARAGLLPAIYFVLELGSDVSINMISWSTFTQFMQSPSHQFIVYGALFFGLLMGLAEAQILDYATFLRQAARKLKEYSEWSLERGLINSGFDDPAAFNLRRVERAVLFMDIRGFTAWAEQTDPAETVAALNQYYNLAEKIIIRFRGHKPSFTADEVMTRFDSPVQAVAAARVLQTNLKPFLAPHQLAVGIGIHTGIAMEGLLGSDTTKQFDIIGDTVNTAKRLESAANGGEILISAPTRNGLPKDMQIQDARSLRLKGKSQLITTFSIVVQE